MTLIDTPIQLTVDEHRARLARADAAIAAKYVEVEDVTLRAMGDPDMRDAAERLRDELTALQLKRDRLEDAWRAQRRQDEANREAEAKRRRGEARAAHVTALVEMRAALNATYAALEAAAWAVRGFRAAEADAMAAAADEHTRVRVRTLVLDDELATLVSRLPQGQLHEVAAITALWTYRFDRLQVPQ